MSAFLPRFNFNIKLIMSVRTLIITALSGILVCGMCACSNIRYQPYAPQSNSTMFGTPVKTRMTGKSSVFRFLGIGGSPSQKAAMDRLYASAGASGYPVARNNYAFQNISTEEERIFLYPFIGVCTLTVTADLYAYENCPHKCCGSVEGNGEVNVTE